LPHARENVLVRPEREAEVDYRGGGVPTERAGYGGFRRKVVGRVAEPPVVVDDRDAHLIAFPGHYSRDEVRVAGEGVHVGVGRLDRLHVLVRPGLPRVAGGAEVLSRLRRAHEKVPERIRGPAVQPLISGVDQGDVSTLAVAQRERERRRRDGERRAPRTAVRL